MALLLRVLPDNPVLTKELRVRMRGARAYWILFGYLGFLSAILLFQYWAWLSSVRQNGGGSEASRLGGEIFLTIVVTQMFLVLFITPAITSGSLTIEREQRTMDMLTMTRMPRHSIIAGKLLAAVSFTALLLISSLPLISICFMLGSVDPGMVVSNYLMLLMGSFFIGAMGLMWSSIARTTTQAVMYTYATLCFIGGAIPYAFHLAPNFSGTLGENILRAVGSTWFGNVFLGIHGPDGIGFSLLCLLAGILFAAIAMARIEMWPERKAPLLRGLATLLIGVQLLALDLWWLNAWYQRGAQAVQSVVQPPVTVLCLTALALMLLVPTYATGEIQPYEARRFWRYLAWGWTPRGLARGKLASGLPFLLLLTLFGLGLYVFSFVLVGKPGAAFHTGVNVTSPPNPLQRIIRDTTITVNGRTVYNNTTVSPTATTPNSPNVGDFPQAVVLLLVSVLGFSLFCMFLSVVFRNRWVAWLLAYVFLIVILIAPEIAHLPAYVGASPNFGVNLYYLNPYQSLLQMGDPTGYYNNALLNGNQLLLGKTPLWLGTVYSWLLIGGLSFLLTLLIVAREKRRSANIPYEETVAGL
jgi:ABC-type Na+ efflux pump permease subunit